MGNSCFAEAYKLNTVLRSNGSASILNKRQSDNYPKLIFKPSSSAPFVSKLFVDVMFDVA